MFAKHNRNHLQDRLLQIESKGIENTKKKVTGSSQKQQREHEGTLK